MGHDVLSSLRFLILEAKRSKRRVENTFRLLYHISLFFKDKKSEKREKRKMREVAMNLITDDKRAFEYNYSHVSEEAKRNFFT